MDNNSLAHPQNHLIKIIGSYLRDVRIHIQSLRNCVEVLFVSSECPAFCASCGRRSEVKRKNLRKFGSWTFRIVILAIIAPLECFKFQKNSSGLAKVSRSRNYAKKFGKQKNNTENP